MHFEILVEDRSGEKALEIIVPKIIGDDHTFKIHSYKGIGSIPKNPKTSVGTRNRTLLGNLHNTLQGYGRTHGYGKNFFSAVIVVCDLDARSCKSFLRELNRVLDSCDPKPQTRFCIAIEEGEAWFLGDMPAIKSAYPKAKRSVLKQYVNDSICGTWELLADAIFPGGKTKLSEKSPEARGKQKSKWAEKICPRMDVRNNKSPSFNHFREKLLELIELAQTA